MKYKVGDKVRIREDLVTGGNYGGYVAVDDMTDMCGSVVTIEDVDKSSGYGIKEDPKGYTWTDEMFEPVEEMSVEEAIEILAELCMKQYTCSKCPIQCMWWIIGRYLADGWRVERKDRPSGGRIVFAISDDKRAEFEQRLREAKLHGTYTKERTCGKYHVCNNQLYEYLEKFGKYAHGKRVPREALCLPREKAKYFFDGYMSGDGRSDREEATSTSAALILGMCIIAQRLGKSVPAVYYTRRDEKCVIQGRECRQRDTYTFRISSKSVKGHYRARYVCRELYQPKE